MEEHRTLAEIPESLCGVWCVLSAKADGEVYGGEILDVWRVTASAITLSAGKLYVRAVEATSRHDGRMHLVSFSNNGLQFVFLQPSEREEVVVVQCRDGAEHIRCLLAKPPPGFELPSSLF